MGGFLQSLIFGYGGLRLRPDRLDIRPVLPPGATETHYVGLAYMGNTFDLFVHEEDIMITVTSREGDIMLHLYLYESDQTHDLGVRVPVRVKRQRMCVVVKGVEVT